MEQKGDMQYVIDFVLRKSSTSCPRKRQDVGTVVNFSTKRDVKNHFRYVPDDDLYVPTVKNACVLFPVV